MLNKKTLIGLGVVALVGFLWYRHEQSEKDKKAKLALDKLVPDAKPSPTIKIKMPTATM